MIKKLLSAFTLSCCSLATVYAGTMGEVKPLPVLIPFVAGEGMYTWPDVDGFHINILNLGTFDSVKDENGWGGRLAAGMIHPLTESFAGSAEVGWGYYGSVDMHPKITLNSGVAVMPTSNSFKVNINQYGFDILAGLLYTKPSYDLFIKVGALIQNLRFKAAVNPIAMTANVPNALATRLNGTYAMHLTLVNALPELKLGGAYHLSEDWLVTLAWMHAFGSSLSVNAPNLGVQPIAVGNIRAQIQSPTINTILFGLEYRFNS
jgi:hypothetical protein